MVICSSLYLTREWTDFVCKVHSLKNVTAVEKNSFLPICKLESLIFKDRLVSVPFGDYGGPSGKEDDFSILLKKTIEIGKKEKVDFIEIRTPKNKEATASLENEGFCKRVDYCTFRLVLKPEEVLLKGMEKRTRNDIAKALKSNFEVLKVENNRDLKAFYELYLSTMKNLGSPPQPLNFFEGLSNAFLKTGSVEIHVAYLNKVPMAGAVFLLNGKEVHYSYSCYKRKYAHLRAVDFILWRAITTFYKRGFETFDFGRTRFGSGVYNYKKGWNGVETLMPYFYYYFRKTVEQRDEVKYEKLSKMWSLAMPQKLAKIIGPWLIRQIG